MRKLFYLYIFTVLLGAAGILAFADEPSSSLDDKPSVDTAATSQVQIPTVPSDATAAADTHTSYLYDLKKLIEKSRANIKEVNEKIMEQAVLKRNQKREERAREYYEKGVALTNEGKLDQAREYFEKAIAITDHPEMAGYIKESQRRLRKQEAALQAQENEHYHQIKEDESTRRKDVEEAYKEAVALYKEKKYHPAKDAFRHVDEIAPDYRATSSYLKIIDQDILIADALAAKQQAVEIQHQQKEAEEARAKEKQMWLQQIEEKERERKKAIDKQAQQEYDQAVDLYNHKKFALAKKKFEEVSWVLPDYKATMKYLSRIDNDAQKEKERLAHEQDIAMRDQKWEEEVEHKKQEALRMKELEAKERQHKKDIEEQAQFLYKAAVALFDRQAMDAALDKFEDIQKLLPDFKSTNMYIARIEQAQVVKKLAEVERQKKQMEAQVEALRQVKLTEEQQHKLDLEKQALTLYGEAIVLYGHKFWDGALEKFNDIEKLYPDYKDTRVYIERINKLKTEAQTTLEAPKAPQHKSLFSFFSGPAAQVSPAVVTVPATSVVHPSSPSRAIVQTPIVLVKPIITPEKFEAQLTLEEQEKQTQDIADLARRSAQLYRAISEITDDRYTAQTRKKISQIDDLLNRLKLNKERVLRQMQEEQHRRQLEETRAQRAARLSQAQSKYNEGKEYFNKHDYVNAKIVFKALDNLLPDYRFTRRYLGWIDEYQNQRTGMTSTNQAYGTGKIISTHQEIETVQSKDLLEREELERSELVNKEERQKVLDEEQRQQADLQSLAQKASDINDDIIQMAKTGDYEGMKEKFTALENTVIALKLYKEKIRHQREPQKIENVSASATNSDQFKQRENLHEQDALYNQAVNLYEQKKYVQARLLFGQLDDQHDRRAKSWLKKVDHAISFDLIKNKVVEEQERTAFIAEQLKAQRELVIIQEREHQRQKRLSEELERQKHLFEDDHLMQLRKEEILKTQERERQRQEEKRLQSQKANEKQEENLRFHKIKITPISKPNSPAVAPSSLTKEQLKEQIEYSKARKAYLDNKYKNEQPQRDLQAKIDAENQHERKLQEQLAQKEEAERQAKLKADADIRLEESRKITGKLDQERKRRAEIQHEQEQEREVKIKQDQILREEAKRRQEFEREEKQRQAQLEAQRESVRKELEEGVEDLYQEALSLYKQGNYQAAADKFKDVQDIIPDYKRSAQYMDEARSRTLPSDSSDVPQAATDTAMTPPVSHQENVTKALDIFDPNAK